MMSAVVDLIRQVTTIATNTVLLHPIVPAWSVFKLNVAVPMLKMGTQYQKSSLYKTLLFFYRTHVTKGE